MGEIKINEFMEIHYDISKEKNHYPYMDGYASREELTVSSFRVLVSKNNKWTDITHALPIDFYDWCLAQCEKHLAHHSEVA